MTRVATVPLQRTLSNAIQRSQQNVATSQLQLTSGKKATDYAGLGIDAVRTLSARSMLAQQHSYQAVASRVGTTLSLYDANITQIDDSLSDLRQQMMEALGTGNSPGLQSMVESSFASVRASAPRPPPRPTRLSVPTRPCRSSRPAAMLRKKLCRPWAA